MNFRRVSRPRVTRRLHATRAAARPVPSKEAMETGSVLVVDDDPKILELVRAYLQRAGYAVVTAVDGEDALRKIEAHRPNLVVLDVMLPHVDGLVLARHLRDERNNLPVLMMSARGTVSDRITGLVEGADDYLAKPFSPAELVARVNALMRRSAPLHQHGTWSRLSSRSAPQTPDTMSRSLLDPLRSGWQAEPEPGQTMARLDSNPTARRLDKLLDQR